MENKRLKIFVSSYACEPNLGSEIGVGWHWVLEMNKYFELWVLTRQSNKKHIEDWLKENPQEHEIHWLYYDTPYWMRWWKKGLRGVRLYYMLWQQMADSIVRKTMVKNNIKIFHLLTYGNALWPISNFGQKQFFIWGPVGGVDSIPKEFSCHYSSVWKKTEKKRRLMVKLLPFNFIFQRQCKNANLILCKSYSIYNNINEKYRSKAMLFTDVAVAPVSLNHSLELKDNKVLQIILVGRLEAWRGFDLAIAALAKVKQIYPNFHLDIIGKGTEKEQIDKLIQEKEMSQYITLTGQLSATEYREKLEACDIVLNPSLKEGAVTTAFEAMALGKPLICVDTGGYTRYFDNSCAIVIPRGHRNQIIDDLKQGILDLTDKSKRQNLGNEAKRRSLTYTWEDKGKSIYEVITKTYYK